MSEDRLSTDEWETLYEQLAPIAKQHTALLELWTLYLHMAAWETPDWGNVDATEQAMFREMVETDDLYECVEEAKERVLRSGLSIPDRWLWPLGTNRIGEALSDKERHEISQIAAEMLCRLPRLRPGAQPRLAENEEAATKTRWSKADSPSEWAKVFGVEAKTFSRWVKLGKIRAKEIDSKNIMVDLDDLPGRAKR